MKKNYRKLHGAYTLAETLITLGIIGIIAAILIPLINNVKPDDTKALFLQAYDSLTTSVKSLAHTSSIYGVIEKYDNNNIVGDISHFPFLDQKVNIKTNFSGQNKFCNLIAEGMGVSAASSNCKTDTIQTLPYSDDLWDNANNYFQTKNGMKWIIRQEDATPTSGTEDNEGKNYTVNNVINHVYVNVQPREKNCIYDSVNCKQPNVFHLAVGADGSIAAYDARAEYYLDTRNHWLKSLGNRNTQTLTATVTLPIIGSRRLDCISQGANFHWFQNRECVQCSANQTYDDTNGCVTIETPVTPEPNPDPDPEPDPEPDPDPTPTTYDFYCWGTVKYRYRIFVCPYNDANGFDRCQEEYNYVSLQNGGPYASNSIYTSIAEYTTNNPIVVSLSTDNTQKAKEYAEGIIRGEAYNKMLETVYSQSCPGQSCIQDYVSELNDDWASCNRR